MRINVQGWHEEQLIKLAEANRVSVTSYITNLITQAQHAAKENDNEEAANLK